MRQDLEDQYDSSMYKWRLLLFLSDLKVSDSAHPASNYYWQDAINILAILAEGGLSS